MNTVNTEDFRPLDLNEIEAVSGGTVVCEGSLQIVKVGNAGTLEIGFEECDNLPGVKIPVATWTPSKPRR
jgi:hypothetical protein